MRMRNWNPTGRGGGRPKYGNRKTVLDGIKFDSKAEAARYATLKLWQRVGDIQNLECQPRYDLIVNGQKVGQYVGDFRYQKDGRIVVEDVKSEPTKTSVYRLKARLMKAIHGIDIVEVMK